MKNVKFGGIPQNKDEFCGSIPKVKPKFRGSARNSATLGPNLHPTLMNELSFLWKFSKENGADMGNSREGHNIEKSGIIGHLDLKTF